MLRPASAYPLAVDDRHEDCADVVTAQSGSKTPFSAAPLSGLRPRARLGNDVMRDLGSTGRTRVELDDVYQETLRVNELLETAGREWFEIYGAVVE